MPPSRTSSTPTTRPLAARPTESLSSRITPTRELRERLQMMSRSRESASRAGSRRLESPRPRSKFTCVPFPCSLFVFFYFIYEFPIFRFFVARLRAPERGTGRSFPPRAARPDRCRTRTSRFAFSFFPAFLLPGDLLFQKIPRATLSVTDLRMVPARPPRRLLPRSDAPPPAASVTPS